MALETGTYISDLVETNPTAADPKSAGDDHLRLLKATIKATFPNITGAVTKTHTELNTVTDRGLIAGQAWTGTHTFPATTYGVTAAFGSSGTAYATLDYVNAVATNAALPAQSGNAWKLPITNGTTVAWSGDLRADVIKFVDGTDTTKKLAFSLSSLTTATTRTVTVPDKSGTMAMISDTALTLLASVTPTAAATLDFLSVFTSSYDNYLIVMDGLKPSADASFSMRMATGGAVDTTSTYYQTSTTGSTTTGGTSYTVVGSSIAAAGTGLSGQLMVTNANSTSSIKVVGFQGMFQTDATPTVASNYNTCAYLATNTVSGFRLYFSSNFQATGKVRVYGIQN